MAYEKTNERIIKIIKIWTLGHIFNNLQSNRVPISTDINACEVLKKITVTLKK